MNRLFVMFLFGTAVCCPCACERVDAPKTTAVKWLELEIDRPEIEITPEEQPEVVESPDGDELITNAYVLPPSFLMSAPGRSGPGDSAPDPFAKPEGGGSPKRLTAKEILEAYGVVFPPGAWAKYQWASSTLLVRQTRDQMDLVEAATQSLGIGPEAFTTIDIRLEIFELTSGDARRLEQSASEHFDSAPERNAVIDLVKQGGATIVTTMGIKARSGQRANSESGVDFRYVAEFDWKGGGENRIVKPVFKNRIVGTVMEVDPVCGPSGRLLDIRVSLEHHTAPPRMEKRMMVLPVGDAEEVPVPFPVFSFHKLDAYETMTDGGVKLLGSWDAAAGAAESGAARQMAFLITHLQPLMGTDWDPRGMYLNQ